MTITPYLFFPGTCEEALTFYAEVFGGEIIGLMHISDAPNAADFPEDQQGLVMNASLRIGEDIIMGSDDPSDDYQPPRAVSLHMGFADRDRASRVFSRLAKNGEITLPFANTFWSQGFGTCTDRYGVRWMISCDPVRASPEKEP